MHQHEGTHGPHMKEPEAHVDAAGRDLEYFRTKRLEPRVLHYLRRGVITIDDLARARAQLESPPQPAVPEETEARVRALEDRLDALVRGIGSVSISPRSTDVVIEDIRRERGDYDEHFRLHKHKYAGSLTEKMAQVEAQLSASQALLDTFRAALVAAGEHTEEDLAASERQLQLQGEENGARIVARAWVDPAFRRRLVETGREAVRELGIPPGRLGKLAVAENTDEMHNVVVCTLCSCYPHDLLGDPPWWYRTDEYRQRIVDDPRTMLREMFGLEISPERTIAVRDSTSDVRWMVLPARPPGTEHLSEEALVELIKQEHLVGVEEVASPEAAPVDAPGR